MPAEPPDARPPWCPAPGTRVVLSRPGNPRHFRRGLVGVVRESSVYRAPAPRVRYGEPPKPAPPARGWLWISFEDCPHNGDRPFLSPAWADEVEPLEPNRCRPDP